MKNVKLELLSKNDIDSMAAAFAKLGWDKPRSQFEKYLSEQEQQLRTVVLAIANNNFVGYVTIKWKSDYPSFIEENIPEISDLNVLPEFRNNGIGTLLLEACESLVNKKGFNKIGLGVGLTSDYGNAQRLYFHLGYIPDGNGLHYKYKPVVYSDQVIVDDDLVIFLSKILES